MRSCIRRLFSSIAVEPVWDRRVFLTLQKGRIVNITLDSSARRNPLSLAALRELDAAIESVSQDKDVRVAVIRPAPTLSPHFSGASGPVFSAGHDLRELLRFSPPPPPQSGSQEQTGLEEIFSSCSVLMQKMRLTSFPIIAQVSGLATAAGLVF